MEQEKEGTVTYVGIMSPDGQSFILISVRAEEGGAGGMDDSAVAAPCT